MPDWGSRRFACECGQRYSDGMTALMHAFEGHEVVREVFRGKWHFETRVPVMEQVVERLRLPGESMADLTRRLSARMAELEVQ